MREMPAVKRMDTAVFLFLSILIGGSVLFGYRTFAIPPSHYVYLSCGGSCEKIVSESLWQTRHLWKFGKRKRDGDESHREMVASYLTQSTLSTFLKNHAGQPTRPSDVNILLYETIHLVRAGLYRPLYLLSVLFGLSFHFLFSIVLAILMMTTAILAEKITINVRQTWGRGLYLAAQMIPFFFTHGRLVVLAFSVVLLLYLHLAPPPPPHARTKNMLRLALGFACLLCATLSTGIFFVVYAAFVASMILRWKIIATAANRTLHLLLVLAFSPFAVCAVLKNLFFYDNDPVLMVTLHGNIFRWNGSRLTLTALYGILLYAIALLPLIPRFRKTFYVHHYFHFVCVSLALMGMFLASNFGRVLLILNCVLLKLQLLDQNRNTIVRAANGTCRAQS